MYIHKEAESLSKSLKAQINVTLRNPNPKVAANQHDWQAEVKRKKLKIYFLLFPTERLFQR